MYQQITLVGRLGQDPEMRYTPSGVAVTSFSLAVGRSWTGQDGQRQEKTTWFRITAWRKSAELASQYLAKGRQVLIVGEIEEARPWTDRDGNMRASLEVTAQSIKFLGSRDDVASTPSAGGFSGGGGGGYNNPSPSAPSAQNAPQLNEEDIPF